MNLLAFNTLPEAAARKELFACCGSEKWADSMMEHFPFASEKQLVDLSAQIWYDECTEADWRESFTHHPKIGDVKSLSEKFAGKEQAGVAAATQETIRHLAQANTDYQTKFGFIFIVCATGKSAEEMLALLQDRLQNTPEEELHIAMGEQQKISIIRFRKMLPDGNFSFLRASQVTTHVLDTSTGIPGKDISIRLQSFKNNSWQTIAQGITNNDGRIPDLLPQERNLKPGTYKMVFDTGSYYEKTETQTFYPKVEIIFTTFDETHYHVPLLVNPFGYSTYRGS
jgi:5-hydroxyisourate hydrolase / 2-oxo-4-hydroxy-4-carboxy-5-ureidoimidazoline decarboxylase